MYIFKCKERNLEVMTRKSCAQCFLDKKPMNSRPLCKAKNQVPTEFSTDAIEVSKATRGVTYRTTSNALVKVEIRESDKLVRLFFEATGNRIDVPSNTIVFSDISKILSHNEETGNISKRGESKTSYIDNLLSDGTIEFQKIVELVVDRFKEDEKKVKRLVWSRRATLKKK